ncbi:MAG: ABC transporter permease subunit [Oscillospiraceae bacterium]|nr:ABC transporter permease subunit [Oscillospiraceae bacterium]
MTDAARVPSPAINPRPRISLRIDPRSLLPLAAILVSFLAETLLPNHEKLRNPDYTEFRYLLGILTAIFAALIAAAVWEGDVRKAAKSRTLFTISSGAMALLAVLRFGGISQSKYSGFLYLSAAVGLLLFVLAVSSLFIERIRALAAKPGWATISLLLFLLFVIVDHEAIGGSPYASAVLALTVVDILALLVSLVLMLVKSLSVALAKRGVFIAALILFLGVLNVVTAKFLLLPQIYFPSLSRVIHVYREEFNFLFLDCLLNSFILLCQGVGIGLVAGVVTGILVGWSQRWNYWLNPFVRILGPIPTSTWVPLAIVMFSRPRSAAVFVIAFGVWFQISILTASGIQNVKKSYYEVSSTLGATELQNLFHIAIPDALPSIFLGFFNATCSSFAALVVAEMLGVKNGLGWYINWQKEMLAYPGVYAGLVIMAGFCYVFITIQFKVRDKLLSWQKGVIKW